MKKSNLFKMDIVGLQYPIRPDQLDVNPSHFAGLLAFLAMFLQFYSQLAAAGEFQFNIGAPVSQLTVGNEVGSDSIAATKGLFVGMDYVTDAGNSAITWNNQSAIGPGNSLVASGTAIGISRVLFGTFGLKESTPDGFMLSYKPKTVTSVSILLSRSRFDLETVKEVPDEVIVIEKGPILSGQYTGLQAAFTYSYRFSQDLLVFRLFYEQSLSSPGQDIEVSWLGISFAYGLSFS